MATDRELGKIEVKKLVYGYGNISESNTKIGMMENNTHLQSVDCNFPVLKDGTNMFSGCENLETFTGKLSSLQNGTSMFEDCKSLKTFKSDLYNLSTYTDMFKDTKLNTFDGGDIGITGSGLDFITNSYLENSKNTLTSFKGNLLSSTNTSNMFKDFKKLTTYKGAFTNVTDSEGMFYNCIALESFSDGIWATNAESMFRGCENLNYIDSYTNNLQIGKHMFRACSKLNENNFHLGSISTTHFYETLVNGIAMFQGTSFTKIPDTWEFKSLEIAKQMFQITQLGADGKTVYINMPKQFPKVKVYKEGETYKYGEAGETPVSYMFGSCPIKSINFDVTSLDNGTSMFANCTELTECTGAKFQESGYYQSMFTESKFNQASAQYILYYAKLANVAKLHIGIGFQLTEDHDFVKENSLMKYSQDNSGRQWCEGYAYCHCHNANEEAAREYFQQHGVANHCHSATATTYYFELPSIMFVCNPN